MPRAAAEVGAAELVLPIHRVGAAVADGIRSLARNDEVSHER
jgi:hypothetical protein